MTTIYKGHTITRTSTTISTSSARGYLHTIHRADRYASPADVSLSSNKRLTSIAAAKRYIDAMLAEDIA